MLKLKLPRVCGTSLLALGAVWLCWTSPMLADAQLNAACEKAALILLDRTLPADRPGFMATAQDGAKAVIPCVAAADAEPNNGQMQYLAGIAHKVEDKDDAKTAASFQRAVALKYAPAYYELAMLYFDGKGVAKDVAESDRLLKFGAEAGDILAMAEYGVALAWPNSNSKQAQQGFEWINKAAATGDIYASFRLAECYFYGFGTAVDKTRAIPLLKYAADHNHGWAANTFAVLLYDGDGIPKDEAEAIRYYKIAATRGNSLGKINLAKAIFHGDHIAMDKATAFDLFLQAVRSSDDPTFYDVITGGDTSGQDASDRLFIEEILQWKGLFKSKPDAVIDAEVIETIKTLRSSTK